MSAVEPEIVLRGTPFHVEHGAEVPGGICPCGRACDLPYASRCRSCRNAWLRTLPADDPRRNICRSCLKHRRRSRQRDCKRCHADWMKKNRTRFADLTDEQRQRANCRSYTNTLIRRGTIARGPCAGCGADPGPDVRPRHDDYTDPHDVRWSCDPCERARQTKAA